jgi:hypothetical protein
MRDHRALGFLLRDKYGNIAFCSYYLPLLPTYYALRYGYLTARAFDSSFVRSTLKMVGFARQDAHSVSGLFRRMSSRSVSTSRLHQSEQHRCEFITLLSV